jgi:hypothetical protein
MGSGSRGDDRDPGVLERMLLERIDPRHRTTKRALQVLGPVL